MYETECDSLYADEKIQDEFERLARAMVFPFIDVVIEPDSERSNHIKGG